MQLHRHSLLTDHVTQERDFSLEELTLVRMSIVSLLLQSSQHPLHQLCVLLGSLGVDENIVDEHHHSLIELVLEYALHLSLKPRRCVLHPERHTERLIQA